MELSIVEKINNKIKSSTRGFTLIELLVVISIISIISMVGLVSYNAFLKNSRDSRREADLKFIQSALEEYHSDQIYYPSTITFGSALTNLTGRPTPNPLPTTKTYLSTIPSEPVSTRSQYSYQAMPTGCNNSATICTSYCLYAALEVGGASLPPSDSVCPTGSTYNYGITKP